MDGVDQRTGTTQGDSAFGSSPDTYRWRNGTRGAVISADPAPTATRDRFYQFGAIGNREKAIEGRIADLAAASVTSLIYHIKP